MLLRNTLVCEYNSCIVEVVRDGPRVLHEIILNSMLNLPRKLAERRAYLVRKRERSFLLLQLFSPVLVLQQPPRRLLHPATNQTRLKGQSNFNSRRKDSN